MAAAEHGDDINFYHALGALIEHADRDRRAIRDAARNLNQAAIKLKHEFPDYAVLNTLTEQAEQDQNAIEEAIRALEEAVRAVRSQAELLPILVAKDVSAALASQIEISLSNAADLIVKGANEKFSTLDEAFVRAHHRLEDTARFAAWKITSQSRWLFLSFLLGLLLGISSNECLLSRQI